MGVLVSPQILLKIDIIKLIFMVSFSSFPPPEWHQEAGELTYHPGSEGTAPVIWSLAVGLFPHSSFLDVTSLTGLWVRTHLCCWGPWLLPWPVLQICRWCPLVSPLQVSSLVDSPHFCVHHWDRQNLHSLFCALCRPQGDLCSLAKVPSLLKCTLLPFLRYSPKFQTQHFP